MATVGSLAVVLTASATDFERTMGAAARAVKSTEKEFMRSARRMEDIGRKWSYGITAPIIAGLGAVGAAAVKWEDDFAGVRKTVDATEQQFSELDKSLRQMTTTIPMTHSELAGIAETAGQLGIQVENIEDFTRTIAMMGTATKMANEETAMGMAQMANIMQTGQKSFDRLGSTIVHLGNNLSTTEDRIMEYGLRIAGAGRIARLTEAQVLGIGGAFASAGVEAEAGGTSISKVLASMTEAVATGNNSLKWFAATAGMSSTEFAATWQQDAGEAFTRFVEGLGASGDQAFGILRQLGLTDQRLIRGFLSVAGSGDLLRRSIDMGTQAWEDNVALLREAEERYKTNASRLKMLRNRAYNVAIAFGGAFSPLLEKAMTKAEALGRGLQRLADWFEKLPGPVRATAGNLLLFLAVIGPATMAFGLLNRTIAGTLGVMALIQGFAGNAVFAFASWRAGAATLGEAITFLAGGPVKLAIMAIGALVVATIYVAANWDKFSALAGRVWSGISAAVLYASSLVVRGIGMMMTAMSWIVPGMSSTAKAVIGMANSLKTSAGQALQSVKNTAQVAEQANQTATAADNAAKAQDNLAQSLELANEAAQGGVQSFDEVHQAQDQMSLADLGTGVPQLPEITLPEIPEISPMGGLTDGISQITETLEKAGSTFKRLWDGLLDKFPPLQMGIDNINRLVQLLKDNWDTVGPAIEGALGMLLVLLNPVVGAIATIATGALYISQNWATLGPQFTALWQGILNTVLPIWNRMKSSFGSRMDEMKVTVEVILNGIQAFWDTWGTTIMAVVSGAFENLKILIDGALRIIADIFYLILAIIRGDWEAAWDSIRDIGIAAWESIGAIAENMWNTIKVVITEVWDNLKSVAEAVWLGISTVTQTIWGAISDWLVDAWIGIYNLADGIWTWLSDMLGGIWDGIKSVAETTWGLISKVVSGAWDGLTATYETAWNGVSGLLSDAWNGIKDTASSIWDGINKTFDSVSSKATTMAKNVVAEALNLKAKVGEHIKTMVDDVVGWIVSLPTRTMESVKSWASGFLNTLRGVKDEAVTHSIVPDMVNEILAWFNTLNVQGTNITDQFGVNVLNSTNNLGANMESSFSSSFENILNGSSTFSSEMESILDGMSDTIKSSLVKQLATSATKSLSTLGGWAAGVVSKAAVAVAAMIKTAYATLLAFFAWSGPFAPALAGGVIAAGIVGIGKVAADALGAFKDVPGLAKGGIVTGHTFAELGEGNRREAVIPLERDNVIADSVGQAVYQAMVTAQRVGQAGSSQANNYDKKEVVLRIDGATFARAVLPAIISEGQRQGLELVARPQGV